jgi:hypothetical protein
MRAAVAALPFEVSKLSVAGVTDNMEDFAARLERPVRDPSR